ncbi:carbon-nitrogen hydrolase [Geopyxis carbonaria]|nr:carbon-nitrogen hydrolase [Geopyxis carbonaria]
MSSTKYSVAVIQLYAKPMQLEANYRRAEAFIREAAQKKAHLAVLPEYFLTSWVPEDPKFADAAEDRSYLKKFCNLAKECNINIVPGTFVEKHVENGKEVLYNIAYFISNEGKVLGNYTKRNLWITERKHLEAMVHTPHTVIDTPLGKVGLLICWDLAFPEAFRSLIVQGAQIIIIPSFWTLDDITGEIRGDLPDSEEIFINATVVSRAFENTACIIYSNAGGRRGRGYAGLSQIAMPLVGVVARAEGSEEQMVMGEVDMKILEKAEETYKIREDLVKPNFHYPAKI